MEHIKALVIKFVVIAIVIYSIFGIFDTASLGDMLWISLLVTGLAYVVGDLYVLPKFGNFIASIGDFGLAFLSIWFLSYLFLEPGEVLVTAALFAAFFITFTEALFHLYMKRHVLDLEEDAAPRTTGPVNVQTEFAEENNEQDILTLTNKREEKKKEE